MPSIRPVRLSAFALLLALVALLTAAPPALAQTATTADLFPPVAKSRTEKLFLGVGFQSNTLRWTYGSDFKSDTSDWGIDATLGWGFTPHLSAYFADAGGVVRHLDIGARLHLLSDTHRIRPFINTGVSFRGLCFDAYRDDGFVDYACTDSPGLLLGGGMNVHSSQAFALTLSASVTTGNFSHEFPELGAHFSTHGTTTRVGFGLTWFPQAARRH